MNSLLNKIKKGQPYSFYGDRRIGKTTAALTIKKELEAEGFKVAYIDCGLIVKENDLWKMILSKFSLDYPGEFKELDYDFTNTLEKDLSNKLLILDEFEILLENKNITVGVFNYLRALVNPETKLNCLIISEKNISDLMIGKIEFIGSPFWNIFVEFRIEENTN